MLDTKGIQLSEIQHKYPPQVNPLHYDVLLDVDEFHKPKVISSFQMCVNIILTLLLMKPGQYPSIPELGIDIEQYLFEYADNKDIPMKIVNAIYDQCNQIQLAGVEVSCFINNLNVDTNELCVIIKGNDFITLREESPTAVIGISYDKLNRLYINRYKIEEVANQDGTNNTEFYGRSNGSSL